MEYNDQAKYNSSRTIYFAELHALANMISIFCKPLNLSKHVGKSPIENESHLWNLEKK